MNKTVLIGRLTKDPDLRFTAGSGTAVTRFTLAVNRRFKKEGQPDADFIGCIAFGKTAETIAQYLVKGRQMALEGHIQTSSYEATDGTKRYNTDIVVDSFEFVGSKDAGATSNNNKVSEFDRQANSFDYDITPVDDEDIPF